MNDFAAAPSAQGPTADVIQHLLEFKCVITEMIERMLDRRASSRLAADAEHIHDVLLRLLRDAMEGIERARSLGELRRVANVIDEMLDATGDEVLLVGPESEGDVLVDTGAVSADSPTVRAEHRAEAHRALPPVQRLRRADTR